MNQISFSGRLGRDAELRTTASGDSVLKFTVADDVGYGDRKTTNWLNCEVWGKRAQSLAPLLVKGGQVCVWGQLVLREWTDKEGQKKLSPDVKVTEVALVGGKAEKAAEPAPAPVDSDIPF